MKRFASWSNFFRYLFLESFYYLCFFTSLEFLLKYLIKSDSSNSLEKFFLWSKEPFLFFEVFTKNILFFYLLLVIFQFLFIGSRFVYRLSFFLCFVFYHILKLLLFRLLNSETPTFFSKYQYIIQNESFTYYLDNMFFGIFLFCFLLSLLLLVRKVSVENKNLNSHKNQLDLGSYDKSQKRYVIKSFSLYSNLALGSLFLYLIFPFSIDEFHLKENQSHAGAQPNIFIFLLDDWKYKDFQTQFEIKKFIKGSHFEKPLLIGSYDSYCAWYELFTGLYSLEKGFRSNFPYRHKKVLKDDILLHDFHKRGYEVQFFSNSYKGSFFERVSKLPFTVFAPDFNLLSILNHFSINNLSFLKELLFYRNLREIQSYFMPSYFDFEFFRIRNAFYKNLNSAKTKPLLSILHISEKIFERNHFADFGKDSFSHFTEILTTLSEKGWLENSLIVFLGDNSVFLEEEEKEDLKVSPFVFIDKSNLKGIKINSKLDYLRMVDVMPSLLSYVFNHNISELDGVSVLKNDYPRFHYSESSMNSAIKKLPITREVYKIDKGMNYSIFIPTEDMPYLLSQKVRYWIESPYVLKYMKREREPYNSLYKLEEKNSLSLGDKIRMRLEIEKSFKNFLNKRGIDAFSSKFGLSYVELYQQ